MGHPSPSLFPFSLKMASFAVVMISAPVEDICGLAVVAVVDTCRLAVVDICGLEETAPVDTLPVDTLPVDTCGLEVIAPVDTLPVDTGGLLVTVPLVRKEVVKGRGLVVICPLVTFPVVSTLEVTDPVEMGQMQSIKVEQEASRLVPQDPMDWQVFGMHSIWE